MLAPKTNSEPTNLNFSLMGVTLEITLSVQIRFHIPNLALSKGVATEVLFGGRTQTHIPPQFSFSSDFGHFMLKILKNAKF